MIKIEHLTIRNFLSFGNVPTQIQLNVSGAVLILGESLDITSGGSVANGTGKTTIINALVYGLYDKPISNISKDNLVNNRNKKNMEVSVTFKKDKTRYTVKRYRKRKGVGNSVELFKNDKDITPDSATNTNKLIEQIIGIPYELFVRVVAFPATIAPFLNLPLAQQASIIEELFDIKVLSEKAGKLKEVMKDTKRDFETIFTKNEYIEREIERHKKQVESTKTRIFRWEQENKREIATIKAKLEKANKVDIEEQKDLQERLDAIRHKLKDEKSKQRQLVRDIDASEKRIKKNEDELVHLRDAKCPYCHQEYKNTQEKITDCEIVIDFTEREIKSIGAKLKVVDKYVVLLTDEVNTISNNISVSNLDELLHIKAETETYTQRLKTLNTEENPHLETLDELETIELESPDIEEINLLQNTMDHQKFLLKLLTKRDSFVRKAILNKSIPFLNTRLAHYLSELGLQHTVRFTHEMTAKITQFGHGMDFGNLSNGQQARVNLALSFAFRDVLQSMHDTINVCMLDEVLDVGLDTVGVKAAAKMLKKQARNNKISMFIISHRDEIDSVFDQRLIVQMSDGFSSLRYED